MTFHVQCNKFKVWVMFESIFQIRIQYSHFLLQSDRKWQQWNVGDVAWLLSQIWLTQNVTPNFWKLLAKAGLGFASTLKIGETKLKPVTFEEAFRQHLWLYLELHFGRLMLCLKPRPLSVSGDWWITGSFIALFRGSAPWRMGVSPLWKRGQESGERLV